MLMHQNLIALQRQPEAVAVTNAWANKSTSNHIHFSYACIHWYSTFIAPLLIKETSRLSWNNGIRITFETHLRIYAGHAKQTFSILQTHIGISTSRADLVTKVYRTLATKVCQTLATKICQTLVAKLCQTLWCY
jgi:hypothetical protein